MWGDLNARSRANTISHRLHLSEQSAFEDSAHRCGLFVRGMVGVSGIKIAQTLDYNVRRRKLYLRRVPEADAGTKVRAPRMLLFHGRRENWFLLG